MRARPGRQNRIPTATEDWRFELLRRARWPHGIVCPWCQGRRVTRHTNIVGTPRRRYLCLECRRTFTDLTGSPFARTNLPLATWFGCLQLLGRKRTTSELAKALGVKWDTAARMKRQLTRCPAGFLPRFLDVLKSAGGTGGA